MSENKLNSGADAPEQVTKILIFVRNSKLPDEIKNIISDPIEKEDYRKILEALLKIPYEQNTISKSIFIPPGRKPRRIQIRHKDLAWLDETKGSLSRSGWLHHVIEAYKKSVEG